ncbi:MAG: hypothetical protein AAF340_00630 [Pseudomonadota bacterium]
MIEIIGLSNQRKEDALRLCDEALSDIELSRIPLGQIALKTSRLARLIGDEDSRQIFSYESSGYPKNPGGFQSDIWDLLRRANRLYTNKKNEEVVEYGYGESIEVIEGQVASATAHLSASADAPASISSANPNQYVSAPMGNRREREMARKQISDFNARLSSRRSLIHEYLAEVQTLLKYSEILDTAFEGLRANADKLVSKHLPKSVKRFSSIFEGLASDNQENWANAVHSCRRIFQDLADCVFPPQEDRITTRNDKQIKIKLGKENYINRIIAFIEDKNESASFDAVVGSHLRFLGERLDAVYGAANKGSHTDIADRMEAERYAAYTYMLAGDILLLFDG